MPSSPTWCPKPSPSACETSRDDPLLGARADQPDRRAHRLQPRLVAADRVAAAHLLSCSNRRIAAALTVSSDLADGSVRIPLTTKPGEVTGWAAYVAGVVWASALGRASGARRFDVDHQRGRDGLGPVVVGGAGMRGTGRVCVRTSTGWTRRVWPSAPRTSMSARQRVCSIRFRRCSAAAATALLIDFRELTVQPVGFDPSSSGVELLLIDSRERHGHVGGEYAARRLVV